jgi:hypothetical protein
MDEMRLLNEDGTQALKQVPCDYESFIKEYHPTIDVSKIMRCKFIDSIKGGKYYVAIGSDAVIWNHKHHIQKVFTDYDCFVAYLRDNNLIKSKKIKKKVLPLV